jgi:isochorismate synthase
MGASPETLISVDKNQVFQTMALAGTQKLSRDTTAGEAVWTQKEIEEQALVCRYIVNCFKKIRLREYDETGPRTVVAGNLMHLRTDFTVDMQATNFPQLGTVMLRLLHPTSAVCGMPKEQALDFILTHEKHRREFYSGYLGPVNVCSETSLFVNLRCMQYLDKTAVLFAGAGITGHSDPEKEWAETEMKCQTMLGILGS